MMVSNSTKARVPAASRVQPGDGCVWLSLPQKGLNNMRIMAWPLARPDSVVLVCGLVRPNLGHPMRMLTLLFHSLRMEERFGGSDWSKSRHFYSPDVDLAGC
jgi:hypothetical protein